MPAFTPEELARWTGGRWVSAPPAPLAGVGTDTRSDLHGRLFVALRGERFDAHDFLADAFPMGAAAAMVEESALPALQVEAPLLVVPDTRAALLALASGYRGTLGTRFVAVTGSAGKTSVKEMLADILLRVAPTARSRGNWNNEIGLPLSLLETPRDARYGVFELGMSHPGELAPLCRVLRHEIGVVTMIAPAHAESFASVADIAREKAEVLAAVPPTGCSVVSADEAHLPRLLERAAGRIITVSMLGPADYRAEKQGEGWFTVVERATGETVSFTTALPGDYVIRNALLAIAVARRLGVEWVVLAEALAAYRPMAMRWQESVSDGVTFINDAYNANPASMRAALQAFSEQRVAGRRWLALGSMRELGASAALEHRQLGHAVAAGAYAGLAGVGELGCMIVEGAREAGFAGETASCADPAAAARLLRAWVDAGDAVLLKGSRGERMENVLKYWHEPVAKNRPRPA